MKCCHFWSPVHVFPLKSCSNRVSGCSQICLTEHILWACCSENRILIQVALVKRNIQNSCFICAWSSQKWEEPRQTSVAGKYQWVEQDLATRENRVWDTPFAFSGKQGKLLISSKSPLFLTSSLQIPFHRIFHATLQGTWRDPKPSAQPWDGKCWSKWNPAGKSEQLQRHQSRKKKKR